MFFCFKISLKILLWKTASKYISFGYANIVKETFLSEQVLTIVWYLHIMSMTTSTGSLQKTFVFISYIKWYNSKFLYTSVRLEGLWME